MLPAYSYMLSWNRLVKLRYCNHLVHLYYLQKRLSPTSVHCNLLEVEKCVIVNWYLCVYTNSRQILDQLRERKSNNVRVLIINENWCYPTGSMRDRDYACFLTIYYLSIAMFINVCVCALIRIWVGLGLKLDTCLGHKRTIMRPVARWLRLQRFCYLLATWS